MNPAKLLALGFVLERVSGSHHIYTHPEIHDIINIQSVNGQAKPYQIKQIMRVVELYKLRIH